MPELKLTTLTALETTPTAPVHRPHESLSDEDETTDIHAPHELLEAESDSCLEAEADSVIIPRRKENSTGGEHRLRAWREISENRYQARKAEEAILSRQRQRRIRKAAIVAAITGVLGTLVATSSVLLGQSPETTLSAADAVGPVFAAPAVAIVVSPGDEPILEEVAENKADGTAYAILEPTTLIAPMAESTPVRETRGSALTTGAFDPQVVDGTLKTWTRDDTAWLQFDFQGTSPLEIHWLDAKGQQALNPWICDGIINRTTGRCYVGRTLSRIQMALRHGAEAGTWTLQACAPETGNCSDITTIEVPATLGG